MTPVLSSAPNPRPHPSLLSADAGLLCLYSGVRQMPGCVGHSGLGDAGVGVFVIFIEVVKSDVGEVH